MKLKTGDTVKILSGKDRGKQGKIIRVLPAHASILVEGVNIKKRHRRSRREDKKGEIILIPAPVPASRAALVCRSCGKPTRIGWRIEGGEKARVCKKCGQSA